MPSDFDRELEDTLQYQAYGTSLENLRSRYLCCCLFNGVGLHVLAGFILIAATASRYRSAAVRSRTEAKGDEMAERSPRVVLMVEDPSDLPGVAAAMDPRIEHDVAMVPLDWRPWRRKKSAPPPDPPDEPEEPDDPNEPLRPYFPDPGVYNIEMVSGQNRDVEIDTTRQLNVGEAKHLSAQNVDFSLSQAPSIVVARDHNELADASELVRRMGGESDHAERPAIVIWLVRQSPESP